MKALGLFLILSTLMPMQGCALFGPGKPVEISRPVAEPIGSDLPEAGVATYPAGLSDEVEEPGVVPDGLYSLRNVMSDKCLEFSETMKLADPPIQKRCRITDTQVFQIKRRGLLNRYTIKSRQHERFLQVRARSTESGGGLELAQEFNDPIQRFAFDRKAETQFTVRSLFSNKVLEVTDNSPEEGAVIRQWEYEGHTHQVWRLTLVGTVEPLP